MNAIRKTLIASVVASAAVLALGNALAAPGQASEGEDLYVAAASQYSRADVTRGLDAARASGELAALNGEDGGAFAFLRKIWISLTTRDAVHAEVLAARADGSLHAMIGEDSGSFHLSTMPRQGKVEVIAAVGHGQ